MPVDNVLFYDAKTDPVTLNEFDDTVILRLNINDYGKYAIFARVVILNADGDSQNGTARLTTLDGETELDRVDLRMDAWGKPGSKVCISLQATVTLPNKANSNIIDMRCSTYGGQASQASLFALVVDDVQSAGV